MDDVATNIKTNNSSDYLLLKSARISKQPVAWIALAFGFSFLASAFLNKGAWIWIFAPLGIVFVLIGMMIALMTLLGKSGSLELSKEGYKVTTPLRKFPIVPWSNVQEFIVFDNVMMEIVGIKHRSDLAEQHKTTRRLTETSSKLHKFSWHRIFRKGPVAVDNTLPETYGMKTTELVQLLERWRQQNSR